MEKINEIVANNIAILRKKNRLSLEELGKLSGVSKSMLALIEKGDGNPTLGILWKIANGLGVPFDELTRRPDPMNHVVKISEIEPIPIADGTARNYSVFSDDKNRRFSVFYLEMDKDCHWNSEPHLQGTIEFFTVPEGSLPIKDGVGYDGVAVHVYIWMEGTGADCVNGKSVENDDSKYSVTVKFAGVATGN